MENVKHIFNTNTYLWKGLVYIILGLLLVGWLFNVPEGLFGKLDAVGYAVCHHIDLRSFHMGERQMPLCVRCSGMYLGAMIGLFYQWGIGRKRVNTPPRRVLVVLLIFVIAFIIDGINSFLHIFPVSLSLYTPQNWLRLVTGTGMGLMMAAILYPAFNQTIWRQWDNRPAIGSIKSLSGLIVICIVMVLAVLTENPYVLYPAAVVSALGVLILLTMIYSMVWMMVLKIDNSVEFSSQLIFPLAAGFGFALSQIWLLDYLRFLLTGTWEGFHIG